MEILASVETLQNFSIVTMISVMDEIYSIEKAKEGETK